jgi:hypothetical protein
MQQSYNEATSSFELEQQLQQQESKKKQESAMIGEKGF